MAAHIPFLTARWSNLALLTYAVPAQVLEPALPPGCRLDEREGRAFVSLVAFDFLDTRVLGIPWPGFRDFPEINLRFYVRRGKDRGVCFIREFVPRRFMAWVARTLYNEPYLGVPMSSRTEEGPAEITVRHTLRFGGREHTLRVTGQKPPVHPSEGSVEHFFKEHQWGFGRTRGGRLIRYEVASSGLGHPPRALGGPGLGLGARLWPPVGVPGERAALFLRPRRRVGRPGLSEADFGGGNGGRVKGDC